MLGRNKFNIFSANSPSKLPIIYCKICLSLSIPKARNIINNGTSLPLFSISKGLSCPKRIVIQPLFIKLCVSICILTVRAFANASSLRHFTSATCVYFSIPLACDIVFKKIIFSALRSCDTITFSAPSIIKYPPKSYLSSPICVNNSFLYSGVSSFSLKSGTPYDVLNTHKSDFNIIGIFPKYIFCNMCECGLATLSNIILSPCFIVYSISISKKISDPYVNFFKRASFGYNCLVS